ncbi:MAG: cell envelope integrity protein TolA [Desulfovermiculus sp.]
MGFASCLLSLLVHIGLIVLAVYAPWQGGDIHLDLDKPVYEVELVRMPEQKQAVQVSSSKSPDQGKSQKQEVHKQPKTVPRKQAKAQSGPSPAPKKADPVRIAKKDKKPQATKARQKKPKPQEPQRPKSGEEAQTPESVMQEAMQDISAQAEDEEKTDQDVLAQELAQLREKAAKQGVDLEGLGSTSSVRGAENVYGNVIRAQIQSNWRFPDIGQKADLKAEVEIRINSQGEITGHSLVRSSGNNQFDASVLRAIARTGTLQSPPNPDLQTIRIVFYLQDMRQ